MTEFIKIATSGLWQFVGCAIILGIVLQTILGIIHKIIRCITISKNGYPPQHCDADGDVYKVDE
jgi:hypothetical protein